ncbi:DEAD/DEAH box helicase family protein [Metallibacterium scheffleri]
MLSAYRSANENHTTVNLVYKALEDRLERYRRDHLALAIENATGGLPPLALAVTVGVGKSYAFAVAAVRAQRDGQPVLILVPTTQKVQEMIAEIIALGGRPTEYRGRQGPEKGIGPWTCWNPKGVEKAGEKNHAPARSICAVCPHGMEAALRCNDKLRADAAANWLARNHIKGDIEPCRFLYEGLPAQMGGDLVVATAAAFSDGLAEWIALDRRRVQRLILVDEVFELGELVAITDGDLTAWIRTLITLREREERRAAHWGEMADDSERLQWIYEQAEQAFREVKSAIALGRLPDAEMIESVYREAQPLMTGGTARWERVRYNPEEDDHAVPLRALSALRSSLKVGVAAVLEDCCIQVYERAPLLEWAKRRGGVVFADATLQQALRLVIRCWGGEVYSATAPQNMRVTRIHGVKYTRGRPGKAGFPAYARAMMRDYTEWAKRLVAQDNGPWAFIVHMAHLVGYGRLEGDKRTKPEIAVAVAADFEVRTGVKIGWWGRHERGHNSWKGCNIATFGMPLLGQDERGGGSLPSQYQLTRAALIMAGEDPRAWPRDVGDLEFGLEGERAIPLPARTEVRRWLLDLYAAHVAQGIGRARAARSEREIQILLIGGVDNPDLDAALLGHGVVIDEHGENDLHNSRRGRPPTDLEAIQSVIMMIDEAGGRVSKRMVGDTARERGIQAGDVAIRAAIGRWRASKKWGGNTIERSHSISAPPSELSRQGPGQDYVRVEHLPKWERMPWA